MKLPASVKTIWGIAILALVLGAGNMSYGHMKSQYYDTLLLEAYSEFEKVSTENEAQDDSNSENRPVVADLEEASLSPEQYLEHIRKLSTRLGYYRFSILGGKCFLVFSALLLLTGLLLLAQDESRNNSEVD